MEFKTPQPLKIEHHQLHDMLHRATKEPGELGEAAKGVTRLMHPHFIKEEEYALPPLGLLPALARGELKLEMRSVLAMTDRLKLGLNEMLREHQEIVAALNTLSAVARRAQKPEYAEFAEKLILHAQTEEEVLYPTAILIGEYVKLKLGEARQAQADTLSIAGMPAVRT